MSTCQVIKTVELNTEIVRNMNLQTFSTKEEKDRFVNLVVKYTDLLPCELEVLFAISRFANNVPGVCWATVETMLNDGVTKIKDRAFRKGIKGLREKGIIIVNETLRSVSGGRGTNIYQLNPEYLVQVVGAGRVQGARAGRTDADEPSNINGSDPISDDQLYLYKEYINNLSKDIISNSNNMENEEEVFGNEEKSVKEERETSSGCDESKDMMDAFSVPVEIAKRLKPYFSPEKVVGIWRYILRTLENIGHTYDENLVLEAVIKSIRKYKIGAIRESFEQYLGGTLAGVYQDWENEMIRRYHEETLSAWIEQGRKFYGLDDQEESAGEIEQTFGDFEDDPFADVEEEDRSEKIRSVYAEKLARYRAKTVAFAETVEWVQVTFDMDYSEAHRLVLASTSEGEFVGDMGQALATAGSSAYLR